MNKGFHILGVCAALLGSASCSAEFVNTAAYGIFPQEETNFTQQNYAVADYLVSQARTFIGRYDVIKAEPLNDIGQPGMSSDFSKMVPQQVGLRLSQLGYHTDLSRVETADNTNLNAPSAKKPNFILSGSYKRRRIEMDVNMRIVDARSKQIVASFDYVVPLTREVAELAKPQPKIVRMTDQ